MASDSPRPLAPLARFAAGALATFALLELFVVGADVNYASVIAGYLDGSKAAGEVIDAQDPLYAVWGLEFIAQVTAGIGFIAWFYRAYVNLQRLSVAGLRFGKGWAIGSWFIPILSLFRPKQMANDVWRASDTRPESGSTSWRDGEVPLLVNWWWGLWIGSGLLAATAAIVFAENASTLVARSEFQTEQTATAFDLASAVAAALAAVFAILVIRDVTRRQDGWLDSLSVAPAPPSAYTDPDAPPTAGSPAEAIPAIPQDLPPDPNVKRWRCAMCGWVFRDPEAAAEHVRRHHRTEPTSETIVPTP